MFSKTQLATTLEREYLLGIRISDGCSSEHYAGITQMQGNATGLTRPKPSMPPSRKHHNRIREIVLQSAGRLFNRHGFNAVSIDDVMAEAELTLRKLFLLF